jgi:serine/threonine protein kinase
MSSRGWAEIKSVLADVLDTAPAERPAALDRLCRDDRELRRAVESLLALETRADDLLDSAVLPGASLRADADARFETIGPYRILSEIGRGGMGVVYLGERADGQYSKRVAIKLITTSWRDPGLEHRFQRERQILAELEHPGIARFLDGGATPEGRPYFVMEYIQGLPLLAWCESRRRSLVERIKLFLQVCDAVSYAHQSLVVHRDLKPGNILVTDEGVAKLLDFGLARVLAGGGDPGDDLTLTGVPLMTPAYASPEQVRGELYTVAGDVYSLGVILYELLSSQRPYQVSSNSYLEMARAICEEEPAPLSQRAPDARLRRSLAGDLENITAKALAKDRALRYASVDDLAADIRRYLEGRPVSARPATFVYRAGKLFRRHRVAISTGTLAISLILTFAGFALWEGRRAERRFQDVRRLAHSVIFELHDSIAHLPGSTAPRELLVRRALEYLEDLSREGSRDPGLAREVALAYEKIADVQGNLSDSNLGRVSAAVASYEKAEGTLRRLVEESPGDQGVRADYLRVANELTTSYTELGRYDRALALVRQSIGMAEADLRSHPADPKIMGRLASAKSTLAVVLTAQLDYPGATVLREQVLDLTQKAAAAAQLSDASRYNLAVAHKRLGALYGVTGRLEDARRQYEEARVIDEDRVAEAPSDVRPKLDLSFDYSDLGWVDARLGTFERALASNRRALALRQQAAAADPNNYRALTTVASSVERIAVILGQMNRFEEANVEFRRAVDLYTALAERPGADWRTRSALAECHDSWAELYAQMAERQRKAPALSRKLWLLANAGYMRAHEILEAERTAGFLPHDRLKRLAELSAAAERCRSRAEAARSGS